VLRAHQFTEDAGPMAHPVRPASYLEINNFYTVTVYNKGAEVVRMYQALLGRDGFRKGMDLYFERHDGQAVTTDDFRAAMADANAIDLDQFQRWYEQSGTPRVSLRRSFDTRNNSLKLWVRQDPGDTAGDPNQPFHIPMTLSLFTHEGEKIALDESGQSELVLELREREEYFEFANVPEDVLISAFRGFSAPVLVETDMSGSELALLMACDDDAFNRWDAGQQYATQVMLGLINADELEQTVAVGALLSAIGSVLENASIDAALKAEMLSLPGENSSPSSVPRSMYNESTRCVSLCAARLRPDSKLS
jgi:aminopeptidase N